MTSSIKLVNAALSPSVLFIRGTAVEVSGKKSVETKQPANNQTGPVKAQTLSWENPAYNIGNIHLFTNDATTLQYAHVLQLYRMKYDNTNASTLIVNYGAAETLLNCLGQSTGIKVVLEDFRFPVDTTDTVDGFMPVLSLSFRETG